MDAEFFISKQQVESTAMMDTVEVEFIKSKKMAEISVLFSKIDMISQTWQHTKGTDWRNMNLTLIK